MVAVAVTLYAEAQRIEEWFAAAAPGQEAIYAIGPALDPANPTAALVARWASQQQVNPVKRRRGDGMLLHCAQRRQSGLAGQPAHPVITDDLPFAADSAEGRVLALLEEAAEAGVPCPSYGEIARALQLRDAQAARYRFNLLVQAGLIAVEQAQPWERRVVTIRATGARTAPPPPPGARAYAGPYPCPGHRTMAEVITREDASESGNRFRGSASDQTKAGDASESGNRFRGSASAPTGNGELRDPAPQGPQGRPAARRCPNEVRGSAEDKGADAPAQGTGK